MACSGRNTADAVRLSTQKKGHFLNRVHKFDSCRGHPSVQAVVAAVEALWVYLSRRLSSARDRCKPPDGGAHWRATGARPREGRAELTDTGPASSCFTPSISGACACGGLCAASPEAATFLASLRRLLHVAQVVLVQRLAVLLRLVPAPAPARRAEALSELALEPRQESSSAKWSGPGRADPGSADTAPCEIRSCGR